MLSKIPQHEFAIVIRLCVFCFLAGSSYTLAKTAADSLFLSRIGSASLPIEFLAAGVATAFFATLWLRAVKRVSIGRLLRITSSVLGVFYLVMWWTLPVMHHSFGLLSLVYVLAEIKGCLYAIVAISSMNETLGRKSSREAWATVLLGFPLAAIVVGTAVGFESNLWDADNWLVVAGLLDFLAILPGVGLIDAQNKRRKVAKQLRQFERAVDGEDPSAEDSSVDNQSGFEAIDDDEDEEEEDLLSKIATQWLPLTKYADGETFAKWFSVLIAAKVMVLTLVAFNWKVSVNEYFESNERSLATFFGWYYAMAGAATLLVQFLVTGRLLSNKSVVFPILILPATMLLLVLLFIAGGGVGMGIAFFFCVTTMAKSMDAWRRSTHDTAIHLLYTSVKKRKRRGLIGHNQGLVKPGSEIAAGIVLVSSTFWFQNLVLVIASVVWLFATMAMIGLVKKRRSTRGKV
jgi:hypothetical protein